jgi:preprotein translocase subunit SecB
MEPTKQPGLRISQIFLARSRFEHTRNPAELPPNTPIGDVTSAVSVSVGVNEENSVGFVSVTVATTPESTGLYRFEVEMVAIIEAPPEANMSLRDYVTKSGPPTLYPFIRETVATLTSKGRFGAVWLPPINFLPITAELIGKMESSPKGEVEKLESKKPRA